MQVLPKKIIFLGVVGGSIFFAFFLITAFVIGNSVKSRCQEAKQEYLLNDCVEASILLLDDDQKTFPERNRAIWVLGQLGDRRALLVLQKYYTGHIPSRESLTAGISQYELKKAINLVSGGINLTAIFWRNNSL